MLKRYVSYVEKLYDIKFIENRNLSTFHEDIIPYDVFDKEENFVGHFYVDPYPRETKGSGA